MPSRRKFLQAGVAVSASNLLLNPMVNASVEASQKMGFNENFAIVIDQTLTQARQFSDAISDAPLQTYQINKDISGLWMNTLEPKLKKSAFPLAGFTRGAPLFFLEYLSKEYGMRLYYRIEHQIIVKAGFEHRVEGHLERSDLNADMMSAGESWPALAGAIIRNEIIEGRYWQGEDIPLLNLADQTQSMQETPFSWMLVPAKA